ncbi:MAG: hypothetical protein ACOY9Y_02175 [Bacillota bacterium]
MKQYAPVAKLKIVTTEGIQDPMPDAVRITTHKRLGEPAGAWSIQLTTKKDSQGRTWADRVKPMDYVVIWLGRFSTQPPVIMRGFVDNVREALNIEDGKPQRYVLINGRDYGGLLQRIKIYYLYDKDPTAGLIGARLEFFYGVPARDFKVEDFIPLLNDKVISPRIANFRKYNKGIVDMITKINIPDNLTLNGIQIQPYEGPLLGLIEMVQGKPHVEFFVTETEEAPALVHRWAPLKKWDGKYARTDSDPTGDPLFTDLELDANDRISRDLGFSGNEAFSYFFTYPTQSLVSKLALKSTTYYFYVPQDMYDLEKPSNPKIIQDNLDRFDFLPLEVATPFMPAQNPDETVLDTGMRQMALELNQWLVDVYGHNHELKNGTIQIKGNEGARIGRYVYFKDLDMEFYIEGVDHEFVVKESFTTTLTMTRGRKRNNVL